MKTINRNVLSAILLASIALVMTVSSGGGIEIGKAVSEASPLETNPVYLPLVQKTTINTIYGHVTDDGEAAANISLELWRETGVTASPLITVTTNLSGDYLFQDVPTLEPDHQSYWVRYKNDTNPTRLWRWYTRELTSFPAGSNVNIGNFDIADVPLIAPQDSEKIVLPYTFQWTPRPATPTDSYLVNIYPYAPNQAFSSPPLGNTDSYNLSSKPANIQYCNPFFWEVEVRSPDDGYGLSFDYRLSTFHQSALAGIHGCVTEDSVPVHGVEVKLCNWLPSGDCGNSVTTSTNNGYFSFTELPNNPSPPYRVVFENLTNPNRLWGYWSNMLYDYTAGSTVFIGDFDIKNIPLNLPDDQAVIGIPAGFSWFPRPNTQWDDYLFYLYDPSDKDIWFMSDPSLGYESYYFLLFIPPGFSPWVFWYAWDVWVWDLWDGVGESYEARRVGFSAPPRDASPGNAPERILPDTLRAREGRRERTMLTQPRWLLKRVEGRR